MSFQEQFQKVQQENTIKSYLLFIKNVLQIRMGHHTNSKKTLDRITKTLVTIEQLLIHLQLKQIVEFVMVLTDFNFNQEIIKKLVVKLKNDNIEDIKILRQLVYDAYLKIVEKIKTIISY